VAGVGDLVSIIKEPPYDVLSPLVTRAVLLSEINKHCLHCNEDERMTTPKNGRKGRDIPLNSNELTAAENLRRIWAIKKKEMDLTQAKLAGGLGVGQSLISQYLNGFIPLNVKMILEFSRLLEVDPIEIAPHMMDIIEAARHGNTLRQNAVITKEGRTVILLEPKDIPGWSVPTPTARAILVERRVGEDCPAGTTVIYDTAVELPRDVITSKRNSLFVVETPGKSAGLRLARLQDDSLADAETAAVICALDDLDKVKVRPVIAKMCLTGV
jgi:transcriptional regulator with XRE-family HTH domain